MISKEEFESTMPVSPPMVKRKMKPIAQSIGASYVILEPWMVASHLKTLMPVGTAIIIVAAVK